jgi:hypothetical protein
MSISEQALSLLDIVPSIASRKKLENFSSLDSEINASFPGASLPPVLPEENPASLPYAVASRMGRPNYEEQAKADALFKALRQMRANNSKRSPNGSRVLRST